jgi:hypothetical protein
MFNWFYRDGLFESKWPKCWPWHMLNGRQAERCEAAPAVALYLV